MDKECTDIIEVAEGPTVCAPPGHHPTAVREESGYGMKVWVQQPYAEVLSATRRVLDEEGLEVLTEIDVRRILAEKLGAQFIHYTILGACSPAWMHQALETDIDVGLLLPCNIVIYEHEDGTIIEAVDPIALLAIAGGRELTDLARVIKAKLQDVVDHVSLGSA